MTTKKSNRTAATMLLLIGLQQGAQAKGFPKIKMETFRGTLTVSENFTGIAPFNDTTDVETSVFAGIKDKLLLMQSNVLPDGRSSVTITDFKGGAMYDQMPFYNESVCYKMPIPADETSGEKPKQAWYNQLLTLMQLPAGPQQDTWHKNGTDTVDGKKCTVYSDPQGKCCLQTMCVDDNGNFLKAHFTQTFVQKDQKTMHTGAVLTDFTTTAGDITPPSGCVDLMPVKTSGDWEQIAANDAELIRKANEEAGGSWVAEASPVFDGMNLAEAAQRHGLKMTAPKLPPRPLELALNDVADEAIPTSFDARQQWKHCSSIGHIRNQGQCGSCWAFAAAESFADRLCIGGGDTNFTGGVEYVLDCDTNDQGCNGGYLDDAWEFLMKTGMPSETCVPYTHCDDPATPDCTPTSFLDAIDVLDPAPAACPTTCTDGSALKRQKAKSAYMVSKPGDVKGMQKEIVQNGPIEVAFFVYSDFQTYSSGIYHRTASSEGPMGGHAVRILGWGTQSGEDYWLVANSWSPQWGEKGYFKIRRGVNECGIETIPAAGLS